MKSPLFDLFLDYFLKLAEERWNRTSKGTMKEEVLEIMRLIESDSFHFLPMRRTWIPKEGKKGKLRPLTIPHPRDHLVMRAMHLVLTKLNSLHLIRLRMVFVQTAGSTRCSQMPCPGAPYSLSSKRITFRVLMRSITNC